MLYRHSESSHIFIQEEIFYKGTQTIHLNCFLSIPDIFMYNMSNVELSTFSHGGVNKSDESKTDEVKTNCTYYKTK